MLFSYGYAWQIINNRINTAALLDISMAMRIRRYGAERIAQYGRSRATLDATGRRQRVSIHPVLPRRTPTQLIKATSCVERLNTTIKAEEHS